MDQLTRNTIRQLTEDAPEGQHVSLFLPTSRLGADTPGDRLRWKTLVNGAESVLAESLRRPDVEALLAPARELEQDALAWQYMSEGLAMFLHPDGHRMFRVPLSLPELATVGDRPVIGPLLPLLNGGERFLLLALSQQQVRLMEGTRNTVEQLEIDAVPTSLRDVVDAADPERQATMARPAASPSRSTRAIFYGHGAGDEEFKQHEVERFLRDVAAGLDDLLTGERTPLIMVGLDRLVATYRDVNSYGHVIDEAVIHNPDELSAEQLHALAWPIVERRLSEEQAGVIGQFRALNGTGRASSDPSVVGAAAKEGRVETLFVSAWPGCWGELDTGETKVVNLGVDEQATACEHLETIAVTTLAAGGEVRATAEPVAPGDDFAAIFRY